jgi:hypothetical protein
MTGKKNKFFFERDGRRKKKEKKIVDCRWKEKKTKGQLKREKKRINQSSWQHMT